MTAAEFEVQTLTGYYRLLDRAAAVARGFLEPNPWSEDRTTVLVRFDGPGPAAAPVELLGEDGGSPEDQGFTRDWAWVAPALEAARALGRTEEEAHQVQLQRAVEEVPAAPVPLVLHCPECRLRHVDVGEFATKPHHTHACQGCGLVWRPALDPTVGVQFLPGYKNDPAGAP